MTPTPGVMLKFNIRVYGYTYRDKIHVAKDVQFFLQINLKLNHKFSLSLGYISFSIYIEV